MDVPSQNRLESVGSQCRVPWVLVLENRTRTTTNSQTKHVGEDLKPRRQATRLGSARLAAAVERINRALTDTVERHATKDP